MRAARCPKISSDADFELYAAPTDETPLPVAAAPAGKSNFQTPIDEVDAAARILDPIFDGLAMARSQQRKESDQKEPPQQEQEQQTTPPGADENEKKTPPFGVFLKAYDETER